MFTMEMIKMDTIEKIFILGQILLLTQILIISLSATILYIFWVGGWW